jgi:glycine/D-amino acid oxidase-like deaminating enzyme
MDYLPISPWVQRPPDVSEPLRGEQRADVAVIGGGYTGLSTAIVLRREGVDVAVVERDFAGAGASGRNAGHLTPTIGKDLPTLLRVMGRERARALVRFADEAVEHTEQTIRAHAIDCDYLPSGNILAGVHPKHRDRLRRAAEVGAELGAHVRYLSPADMRERGLPEAFDSGVLEEKGGHLHPGRYVLGLRRAAIDAGVRLFEQSPVRVIDDTAPVRVHTADGSLVAERAVLATNAYTPALGWQTRALVPLRVSLFETAPLDDETLARLRWPGREGIYTAHEILESYRLTTERTIVGGSKVVRYAYGSGLAPGEDPAAFRTVAAAFRDRFPALAHIPIAHYWGGWIGFAPDFLPLLGVCGTHRNVHFGLAYAGHGVAQATFVGHLLAAQIRGREHPSAAALQRRPWSWPPEPLRWIAYQLITGVLTAIDRRTDRQIKILARRADAAG